jgi:hypothetical protein
MDDLRMPFRELARVLIITSWAQSDPEAATKWVMDHQKDELLRATMFSETVYAWARKDPEGLRMDFELSMYALHGWQSTMLRGVVRGWYDSGKPELEDFIRDLRHGDDKQRAISELTKTMLAKEGVEATIDWVTKLKGDLRYRTYAHSRVAADIAKTDPQRAVAWCTEICETKVGEDLPNWISSAWVRVAGVDAMDWIIAQPFEVAAVRTGIRASFRRLQIGFPDESDAWVEAVVEEDRYSERYQGPVIMYVRRQSNLNRHEVAIEWTTKYIEHEWERERAFEMIGKQWLRKDEEAAEVWLTEMTGLTDDMKSRLREGHRKHKDRAERSRKELQRKPAWVDLDEVS